jgi:hypothetical protein
MTRAIDASAADDRAALSQAWEAVAGLVTPATDLATRAELRRVSLMLSSSG